MREIGPSTTIVMRTAGGGRFIARAAGTQLELGILRFKRALLKMTTNGGGTSSVGHRGAPLHTSSEAAHSLDRRYLLDLETGTSSARLTAAATKSSSDEIVACRASLSMYSAASLLNRSRNAASRSSS